MTKEELVEITLQKLIDHFKSSPESFEFHDVDSKPSTLTPTIYWQPKIQLNDHNSTVLQDPNNCHAVVVMFNPTINELRCYLFLKAPPNLSGLQSTLVTADCVISSQRWLETWRGNYRKFRKLRDMVIDRDKRKENLNYLKKLSSVFPDAVVDEHILDE